MNIDRIRNNFILIPLLFIASILYGFIIEIRNLLYDFRIFKIHKFNIPIISVGNITSGGTGKTPFIMYLIEHLQKSYSKIVVLSRGYGRASKGLQIASDGKGSIIDSDKGGDEPVLIATKFSNIPVIVSEKRYKGIERAIKDFKTDLILLDDAFQHRQVARDCNIVLIDANQPIQKDKILPLGNLRENQKSLNRADVIVITKIDSDSEFGKKIKYFDKFSAEIYFSKYLISSIEHVNAIGSAKTTEFKQESFIAFSGIANPDSFIKSIIDSNVKIENKIYFKDHKNYSDKDIKLVLNEAKKRKCRNIITTEKDLVKLNLKDFDDYNLFVLKMKIEVKNEENFFKKVKTCIDST